MPAQDGGNFGLAAWCKDDSAPAARAKRIASSVAVSQACNADDIDLFRQFGGGDRIGNRQIEEAHAVKAKALCQGA